MSNYLEHIMSMFFQLEGPCWDHVWAILVPCFGYFYNLFACRWLKWLKISLKRLACKIEEYSLSVDLLGPYWGHVLAILGPCLGYFWQYICFQMSKIAQIFTEESCMAYIWILVTVELLCPFWGHVWAILGTCSGHLHNICLEISKLDIFSQNSVARTTEK